MKSSRAKKASGTKEVDATAKKMTTPKKTKATLAKAEVDEEMLPLSSPAFLTPEKAKDDTKKASTLGEDFSKESLHLDLKSQSPGSPPLASKVIINKRVDMVYKLINKMTGSLGGNGYNGAIYGELTMHSMQKVVDILVQKCEFTHHSRFIDVGSGLGKPNFHVAQYPAVRLSIGVELEEIRWQVCVILFSIMLSYNTLLFCPSAIHAQSIEICTAAC